MKNNKEKTTQSSNSRDISFFSDYHSKENRITNYCGLLLKMLYNESPKSFQYVLTEMTQGEADIIVEPTFKQQCAEVRSIPDLTIIQNSFSILFETKLSDWFYSDQILRHIEGFGNYNTGNNILFLLSNFEEAKKNYNLNEIKEKATKENIHIVEVCFEYLIKVLEDHSPSDSFSELLDEFKKFLDMNNLLPRWKYLLDVVNCAGTQDEIENDIYICPNTGGAYSHSRAKYLGSYYQKEVNYIFEIEAVAVVRDLEVINIMNNGSLSNEIITNKSIDAIKKYERRAIENKHIDLQVFILSNRVKVSFQKDSKGGMFGSKTYFWDIAKDCSTVEELAKKIDKKKWSEFGK